MPGNPAGSSWINRAAKIRRAEKLRQYESSGLSQREFAESIGRSYRIVADALRFARLERRIAELESELERVKG